ncbi:hypothetical protein QVD17_23773 [Tagetes erecta]|uniref:Plastid division protein PDV1 n=1 Tax=Tagetes erecta TaxID=13708 RepID=A0AAD8KED0_TARER|nr:hypothetical protein QVD17_23773 [Tagetes erecta]
MTWEMEEEVETVVLEKIWDLHDKLSDTIHSISRSHFLHSIKTLTTTSNHPIQEAKSLNSIRTALENLEDHLHFFHTVIKQQQAEKDVAIARLEQSQIVLALRLADHHGKKYKVIEEAQDFVGQVQNHVKFLLPKNSSVPEESYNVGKRSNILIKVIISSFKLAKKSLKVDNPGAVLGNAAIFALSMLALLRLHQVAEGDRHILDLQQRHHVNNKLNRNVTKVYMPEGGSSNGLDVLSGRG